MSIYSTILCPVCRVQFIEEDLVFIDSIYSIFHINCRKKYITPILASGTFKEMCDKHPYYYKEEVKLH
ncbi:hypothetical protein ACQCT5_06830 [Sutcliffiella halmapala]